MKSNTDIQLCFRSYQIDVINRVTRNIDLGNKMQTVLLPAGCGKTTLAIHLSRQFGDSGKRVLYYTPEVNGRMFAAEQIGDYADVGSIGTIKKLINNHYDIVITDSIYSAFSTEDLVKLDSLIEECDVSEFQLSDGQISVVQKNIYGLHFLKEIIERDNSQVISFEFDYLGEIDYAPIISVPNLFAFKMTSSEAMEYGYLIAEEYEKITRLRINVSNNKTLPLKEAGEYDKSSSYVLSLLNAVVQLRGEMNAGFNSLEKHANIMESKIDDIDGTLKNMNAILSNSKEYLNTFYSVFNEDSPEAELFVSKVINMLISDISKQFASLTKNEKYQGISKFVMLYLGDEAWRKMAPESKEFMIMAKFIFEENLTLSGEVDYSCVCMLSSKTLEVELARRYIIDYEDFLLSEGIQQSAWPDTLFAYHSDVGTREPLRLDDFTLGKALHIMGVRGNERSKRQNYQLFFLYCKTQLMKSLSDDEISTKISEFANYIDYVRDTYRNPSAHKSLMNVNLACDCLDYLLIGRKILKEILETFNQ